MPLRTMNHNDERSTVNSNRDERFFTPRSARTNGTNSSDEWISPRQGPINSDNEFVTPRDIQSERSNYMPQPKDFGYRTKGQGGMVKASSYNGHYNRSVQVIEDDQEVNNEDIEIIFRHARHGRLIEIEAMLDKGIPVDCRDEFGNTLLTIAGQNGNKRVAKLLLRRGADINSRNYKGNTPLHYCYHCNIVGKQGLIY